MDIKIERMAKRDVASLARIANNQQVSRTSGVPVQCSEGQVQTWLQSSRDFLADPSQSEELHWVVVWQGQVVGCCILKKLHRIQNTGELAYWLGEPFWGKGISEYAARLLLTFAFDTLGLKEMHAHCLKLNNPASIKILTKLGFEADLDRPDLAVEGRFEQFKGDVWTFFKLSRRRWRLSQNLY